VKWLAPVASAAVSVLAALLILDAPHRGSLAFVRDGVSATVNPAFRSQSRKSPVVPFQGLAADDRRTREYFRITNLAEQLPEVELTDDQMGLPRDLQAWRIGGSLRADLPGRRIPKVVPFSELDSPGLPENAVSLPEANTLGHVCYQERRFGQARTIDGQTVFFVPQVVLVKFRDVRYVAAIRVEQMREVEAVTKVNARADVAFAELDLLQYRQFAPSDSLLSSQWHHTVIDSYAAWDKTLGSPSIHIAIVDSPFQMDHPDLAANTEPGWSVVSNAPVTMSSGIEHSTLGAGMAAAVLNNGLGVAGAANCRLVPVHINGFTAEVYDAVIWAADNGVRVVNVSWTGADSSTLNDAGLYLQTNARGILAMPGVNGTGYLDYPNQPYIYCISMTDATDNMRSRNGDHIDFAAPGDAIFSTTTGSAYATASGTSFCTPLFCGVVGALFSINPTLSSAEVIEILKTTADDKGAPGWDRYYGWGRINFGSAALAAQGTLPNILQIVRSNSQTTVFANFRPGLNHFLWKSAQLPPVWAPVQNATLTTNGNVISITDSAGGDAAAFYQVRAALTSP